MAASTTQQGRAYIYALTAVLLWSTIASACKITLRHLDILTLLLYASITSTIAFFFYLLLTNRLPSLRTLTKQDYLRSAALGFLNPFAYYLVLFKAYDLLHAQEAMAINWIWPIMLVLLSIPLLRQDIKPVSVLAIIISLSGVFFIATGGNIRVFRLSNRVGVLLALGSTLIWALFWIYNVRDKRDEAVRLFLNFMFGSTLIVLTAILCGKMRAPTEKYILGAIYIGLFEMGITFLVWLKALRAAKTTAHVANLVCLVPFLSLVVIHFVVGEEILASTTAGLALIVAGIVVQKIWG